MIRTAACMYLPTVYCASAVHSDNNILFCSVLRKHAPLFKRTDVALQARQLLDGDAEGLQREGVYQPVT